MAPTRFGNKPFVTNRSSGFVTNRSPRFLNNRSAGFVTNRTGFVSNRSSGFTTNRSSGFITNRTSGFTTNRSRGGFVNTSNRNITDARQLLQRKKVGLRLNTGITDLSQKLRSRTSNTGRFGQQRGGVVKQLYSARMNNNRNLNRPNRFQNNSALRNRSAFEQKYIVPNIARNTVLDRSKFIKVHRGGITVTAKQNILHKKQRLPVGDELEEMSLSDLPEPESLVFTRTPNQSLEDRLQQMMPRDSNDSSNSATVLISNLKHSVTEEDINELFGIVGQMTGAQLLHPGAALVTYARKEDAMTALEYYNNVTLDGMAMHCTILSLDKQKTKPSISSRLGERSGGSVSASFLSPASVAPDRSSERNFGMWSTGRQVQRNMSAWNQFIPRNKNTKFTVCLN